MNFKFKIFVFLLACCFPAVSAFADLVYLNDGTIINAGSVISRGKTVEINDGRKTFTISLDDIKYITPLKTNIITLGYNNLEPLNLELNYHRYISGWLSFSAALIYSYIGYQSTSDYVGAAGFDLFPFGEAMNGLYLGALGGLVYQNSPVPSHIHWSQYMDLHAGYRQIFESGIVLDVEIGVARWHVGAGYAF